MMELAESGTSANVDAMLSDLNPAAAVNPLEEEYVDDPVVYK